MLIDSTKLGSDAPKSLAQIPAPAGSSASLTIRPLVTSSDGDAGNPEPCDHRWMGALQRLMRAETLFRASRTPPQKLGAMYPAGSVGVQSCADCGAAFSAHALAAERGPLWTLATRRPRLSQLLGIAAWSASSALLELCRWVDGSRCCLRLSSEVLGLRSERRTGKFGANDVHHAVVDHDRGHPFCHTDATQRWSERSASLGRGSQPRSRKPAVRSRRRQAVRLW